MNAVASAGTTKADATRASVAALQRKCACGNAASSMSSECDECRREKSLGLQTKPVEGVRGRLTGDLSLVPASRVRTAPGDAMPDTVDDALHSPGRPLDAPTRRFFEARFGHDFGDVRIHADERAATSARALDAHAYTSGRDIVFARGRFDAASASGRQLLAHELTHVVQQRSGLAAAGTSAAGDPAEREADRNAARLHTGEALSVVEHAPPLARRDAGETTVTVEAPASPPGCGMDQHRKIEPAVHGAQQRLRRVVERVDAYIAAPADPANQAVRAALDRHFHSTDPAVAARVRTRLDTIRTDMTSREPFTVECHDATDTSCGNAGAYVRDTDMLVFCPEFFTGSLAWRIGALIHEMAHALTGLNITDRAYDTDRLLPYLSTAEALDNAESYEMFAREVESGRAVRGSPPRDVIDDCSKRTEPLVREAIARAQRWNRDAEVVANDQRPAMLASTAPLFTTHLGDANPGTRSAARAVFANMVTRLRSSIDVRCDNEPAPECSATRRAYKGSASNIRRGLGLGAAIGGGLGGAFGLGALIGAAASGAGLLGLGLFGLIGLGGLALGLLVGLIAGAATRHLEVHVCPNWTALGSVEDRTESLLAALYESYADLDAARSRRYAALARAIFTTFRTAPPPV